MKTSLEACPICGNSLTITRYYCSQCDTTIEGHFTGTVGAFAQLSPEQLNFVLTFIRCEGRLNRMEEELKLSYPTLRNRLVDIIKTLGFEPGKDEQPTVRTISQEERAQILEDMDAGLISYKEAKKLLQGSAEK